MKRITQKFENAEAKMNAMGARAFIRRLYSDNPTPEFTQLKEDWVLGSFAGRFNRQFGRRFIWADDNPPGTRRADFSVYGEGQEFITDIEILSLFSTPVVKNPNCYEDFSPYSCWADPEDPDALHIDIDQPRRNRPYARLNRLIKDHLRDHYPPYWLVVWDNEHGVSHPNLDDLAGGILSIIDARMGRRGLPSGLKQIWLLDETFPDARRIFTAA